MGQVYVQQIAGGICVHSSPYLTVDQWHTEGGGWGVQTPSEIPKALQNRAKLTPIVKTVKKCLI